MEQSHGNAAGEAKTAHMPATPDKAKAAEAAPEPPGTREAEPAEPATPGRIEPTDRKDQCESVSAKDVTLHAELSHISGWSTLPQFASGTASYAMYTQAMHN